MLNVTVQYAYVYVSVLLCKVFVTVGRCMVFIFLFKWKDDDDMEGSLVQDSRLDNIFFAKQVSLLYVF